MTIRIKIIPDPEDVAEMRNKLVKQLGVDAEKLKLFDQFFTEFDAKLAMVDFNNTKYGLYDATDFNLFIDRVKHRKELMDWKFHTEHYLDPARYITIECNLVTEEHNKTMLNAFKRKKNSDE